MKIIVTDSRGNRLTTDCPQTLKAFLDALDDSWTDDIEDKRQRRATNIEIYHWLRLDLSVIVNDSPRLQVGCVRIALRYLYSRDVADLVHETPDISHAWLVLHFALQAQPSAR